MYPNYDRKALDPDFVFDKSDAARDERLAERIGLIRSAVDDAGFDPARRDLLVGVVQLTAFFGTTLEQAVVMARDLDDQLRGCECEVHHDIGGLHVEIIAGEPAEGLEDRTDVTVDGDVVASALNIRDRLVEVDADWDRLDRMARATILADLAG